MRIPYKGQACSVSSPFGNRILNGKQEFHSGIDLVGLDGDVQLVAPCSGVVAVSTIVPQNSGNITWQWGNYVRIDTDDGYSVYMCHMDSRIAQVGQRVIYGTPVGIQGNTGYSFGSHCHFEVRRNGTSLNPAPLLGINNKIGNYIDVPSFEYSIGDKVYFIGSKQYAYAQGVKAVDAETCEAEVTAIYISGKHPYHVIGAGVYGWVDKNDLIGVDTLLVRVKPYRLNMRSGAGTAFPVVGTLKQGDVIKIVKETQNGWGKIEKGGGWISLQYTEKA